MGDCRIGDTAGQVLTTYALGSCIGLSVYDPVAVVGGLLHFVLPDSGIDAGRGRENPFRFADTGIPLLLDQVCARGASKRRLAVHAVGAARMGQANVFEIGKRNYLAARRILWKAGILLSGEAVGGEVPRTVRLEIGSGKVWIHEDGAQRVLAAAAPRKGDSQWRTAF
ncbi:MAG TPA: chemotaxis protein CheD [Bryobacteraceae bacterium]|jgi:chemotaxis protein CheD